MKYFTEEFKSKLSETVAELESSSQVEAVAIIRTSSEDYRDIPHILAAIITFITFTLFMFLPLEFGDYLIYIGTLFSYIGGFILGYYFKPALRVFISKKRQQKNVEIMARAFFQKAGIRHTKEKIGVLFYCSLFEKIVFILPDRGAENAVPLEEWEKMRGNFKNIFNNSESAPAFLVELKKCKEAFTKFIPPVENDINELPDIIDVKL
jgi:putative membrane protein